MLVVGLDLIRSCMGVGCEVWTSLGHVRVLVVGLHLIRSSFGVGCGFGPH